jgi:gamma-glutamyltranspeptidase/glutathione hydrolase
VLCRNGDFYEWGDVFKQPELAKTLTRIREEGAKGFYEGETARLIEEDMKASGGHITREDLKSYRAILREPIKGSYRGYEIVTAPPPSSGGVALVEMLNVLEGFDLRALGPGSSGASHLLVETMKRAFADRNAYLGDPDFVKAPVEQLTDKAYAARLRAQIPLDSATLAENIKPGLGTSGGRPAPFREGEHTTHFSVVDREGNAVATTYTINTSFGSGALVKGAGFLLNNEMDDFTSKPGTPNRYGLVQGEANAIAPRKRPLSSMTPTMVLKDGQLYFVLGTPGGPTIINTVLQTVLNVVDHGMGIQQAVDSPRIHHQWLPDEIRWESLGLNPDSRAALEKLGHKFARFGSSMGSCHAIFIEPTSGHRIAGVDSRISSSGSAGF